MRNYLINYDGERVTNRILEVQENNKQVYKVTMQDGTDYGTEMWPDVFKPGKWLMEVYNLCIEYENEERQRAHHALIKQKEDNFSITSKSKIK